MVDGYLHQLDQGWGVLSALLISAVWGLWHLPITQVGGVVNWTTVGVLLLAHVPFGLALSLFWRKSGNLIVPALSHALADAIRNAIIYSG
jgi:membrane protease YdiL (CAAX protease family)